MYRLNYIKIPHTYETLTIPSNTYTEYKIYAFSVYNCKTRIALIFKSLKPKEYNERNLKNIPVNTIFRNAFRLMF